jgi:hypothetical protein
MPRCTQRIAGWPQALYWEAPRPRGDQVKKEAAQVLHGLSGNQTPPIILRVSRWNPAASHRTNSALCQGRICPPFLSHAHQGSRGLRGKAVIRQPGTPTFHTGAGARRSSNAAGPSAIHIDGRSRDHPSAG